MNHESLTNMAKSPDNPKKPEKSQAELRSVLEQRLKSLEPSLDQGVEEYEQASHASGEIKKVIYVKDRIINIVV